MRTSVLLLAVVLTVLTLTTTRSALAYDSYAITPSEPLSWHFERWVDGLPVNSGYISTLPGQAVATDVADAHGTSFHLLAYQEPLRDPLNAVHLKGDQRYYHAVYPGLGEIFAEQHEPNEVWRFTVNGTTVDDPAGFKLGDTVSAVVQTELPGHWSSKCAVSLNAGYWHPESMSPDQTDFLIASVGCDWNELPSELQPAGWTEVKIPGSTVVFFGRNHAAGEVWTVKVGGKEYSATVSTADPTARALEGSDSP